VVVGFVDEDFVWWMGWRGGEGVLEEVEIERRSCDAAADDADFHGCG